MEKKLESDFVRYLLEVCRADDKKMNKILDYVNKIIYKRDDEILKSIGANILYKIDNDITWWIKVSDLKKLMDEIPTINSND